MMLAELTRGTDAVINEQELIHKLLRGKPLYIKVGFDPTAPDLHLGHTVLLSKMRQWQDFGHHVVFLIGDFTGMIGDPSGKNITRPPLSPEQIAKNAETYREQVFKVLDADKTEVAFNSKWCMPLGADGMIRLASSYTVARILERDDFKKRMDSHQPIAMHELLYPLMQGYDSVALKTDVEMGGTDQRFNLLVGRELQKHFGQEPQCVMTLPLLEGLDGVQKMSKSLANYIGINEPASDIFGKIMSISDSLMWRYLELLSRESLATINVWRRETESGRNPREIKVLLAHELTARFQGFAEAHRVRDEFEARAKQGVVPTDIPSHNINIDTQGLMVGELCKRLGLAVSTSEAFRKIAEGAVRINGDKITDKSIRFHAPAELIVQMGKHRYAKAKLICV